MYQMSTGLLSRWWLMNSIDSSYDEFFGFIIYSLNASFSGFCSCWTLSQNQIPVFSTKQFELILLLTKNLCIPLKPLVLQSPWKCQHTVMKRQFYNYTAYMYVSGLVFMLPKQF